MARTDRLELGTVGLIVGALVLTGPVAGVVDVTARNPTTVGDGMASLSVERVETSELAITDGRFGTPVRYLRIPEAVVTVSGVEGRPRVVYRITVPELDIETVATELLREGQPGRLRLGPRDQGIDPARVSKEQYVATVTVRVQSFEQDETVYRVNETVEVKP